MQAWYRDGLRETTRDAAHDQDILRYGRIEQDLREV
jgi:hypothetical protein